MGALDELGLIVLPLLLGDGMRLTPSLSADAGLTFERPPALEGGSVEIVYDVERAHERPARPRCGLVAGIAAAERVSVGADRPPIAGGLWHPPGGEHRGPRSSSRREGVAPRGLRPRGALAVIALAAPRSCRTPPSPPRTSTTRPTATASRGGAHRRRRRRRPERRRGTRAAGTGVRWHHGGGRSPSTRPGGRSCSRPSQSRLSADLDVALARARADSRRGSHGVRVHARPHRPSPGRERWR